MSFQHPWAYARGSLWAMDLEGTGPTLVAPHVAATFGEVSSEDAADLATAMGLPNNHDVRQRFDAGSLCFAAWVEGQIAAYGWVSWGMECIGELERSLRMKPDEAYIWDCATLLPYRRRGMYSALLGRITMWLHDQGMHRVWIGAALRNHPSIRGFAAAGFQPAIRLTYVRALNLRYVWVSDEPGAPPSLTALARQALAESRSLGSPLAKTSSAVTSRSDAPAEERSL